MTKRKYLRLALTLLLAGCASTPKETEPPAACTCPPGQIITIPPKPPEKPLQPANWSDLPGWGNDDLASTFDAFAASCRVLERQSLWSGICASARQADRGNLRDWFEANFQPWQLVNPDGNRDGLVTGYYEPVIKGSRKRTRAYRYPVFGVPNDLIVVDLAEVYPELKGMRLRGRIEGRKLVPYYSRAEWTDQQESRRTGSAILWTDDPVDLFFLQIQGSGQVELTNGERLRIGYADQNGYPYRPIGKWLAERGEMKIEQTSMQGIKAWAAAHPDRLQELLNVNPSMVFFRELPLDSNGPPGALNVPLTPERSIAVDTRVTPLGSPVWLATTQPQSDVPLQRLVLAQDTGGAIRGPVRADFYWGSGPGAGAQAGRMKQKGQMWALLPKGYQPDAEKAPKKAQ